MNRGSDGILEAQAGLQAINAILWWRYKLAISPMRQWWSAELRIYVEDGTAGLLVELDRLSRSE